MPKIVPKKRPNVFWTCFGAIFSKKSFCRVFHVGSSLRKVFNKSKNFQKSKKTQNRSQIVQKCSEHVLGYFFRKNSFAQCSMEGRVFEMFSKNQEFFKTLKLPKIVPKMSKRVLNMFWGKFFEKIFLPSVPWRVESSKCF